MSKTLDEIRKKLQAMDSRSNSRGSNDKTTYPHWDIPEGTSTTLRFLPDKNPDNTFFWVERQLIKLPFAGVTGQDEQKPVVVQVPCIEMWDGKNTCPILNDIRPMWKDKSLEELARKYWCKRTYYMQGFVKTDPMNENEPPENPIRKFIIGPQLFAIVKAALLDPDMENSPVDYINGTDFIVSKTGKGGYADYGTSKWARKESSINEDMLNAIEQYDLVDLSTYLPKKPTPEQLGIIYEMFQASIDGEMYDPAKWAQHYKPFGFESAEDGGEGRSKPRVQAPARPTVQPPAAVKPIVPSAPATADSDDLPWDDSSTATATAAPVSAPVSSTPAGKTPQEILQMIRNRNK